MQSYCEILPLVLSYHTGNEINIEQTFPKNSTYCCHCPSLELTCSFETPPFPLYIWWSVPSEDIPNIGDRLEGHVIDNSSVVNGMSTLKVSNSSFLREDYACVAIYENGSNNYSRPRPVPQVEG